MNYFNYFTEIETRFQQRRGSLLMLSTLDWALIETWREAGVPLEAVLRGIDTAFDKHDTQRSRLSNRRQRKVNGLAWCPQAVIEAVEQSREAAIGAAQPSPPKYASPASRPPASLVTSNTTPAPRPAIANLPLPPTPPPPNPPSAFALSPSLEVTPRTSNL